VDAEIRSGFVEPCINQGPKGSKIAREATFAYASDENTETTRGPFQTEAATPGNGIERRSRPFQEHQLLNGTEDKFGTC